MARNQSSTAKRIEASKRKTDECNLFRIATSQDRALTHKTITGNLTKAWRPRTNLRMTKRSKWVSSVSRITPMPLPPSFFENAVRDGLPDKLVGARHGAAILGLRLRQVNKAPRFARFASRTKRQTSLVGI